MLLSAQEGLVASGKCLVSIYHFREGVEGLILTRETRQIAYSSPLRISYTSNYTLLSAGNPVLVVKKGRAEKREGIHSGSGDETHRVCRVSRVVFKLLRPCRRRRCANGRTDNLGTVCRCVPGSY